jgi:hypothetical protein
VPQWNTSPDTNTSPRASQSQCCESGGLECRRAEILLTSVAHRDKNSCSERNTLPNTIPSALARTESHTTEMRMATRSPTDNH